MARPIRIEFSGALYHVTTRGDRREAIYEDDDDRRMFIEALGQVVADFNWICHAYCLMSNHYHLVVETPDGNLSQGMRRLNGVFTQSGNRRHGRTGRLFQGRYKAILVDGDSYLLELARYVARSLRHAKQKDDVNIPKAQRRAPPPSLDRIAHKRRNRNAAIVAAHATGGYGYLQIADYFGLHFTTVGRIVRAAKVGGR